MVRVVMVNAAMAPVARQIAAGRAAVRKIRPVEIRLPSYAAPRASTIAGQSAVRKVRPAGIRRRNFAVRRVPTYAAMALVVRRMDRSSRQVKAGYVAPTGRAAWLSAAAPMGIVAHRIAKDASIMARSPGERSTLI